MIQALAFREYGLCGPKELEIDQATQRSFQLETCKLRGFQNSHGGGINCVELEKVEGRYLLTGGGKGAVVIYDTWTSSGTPKHQYEAVCTVPAKHKHKFSVETVQWYPWDNGLFTTSGGDKVLKIWDANRLEPAESYEFSGMVYSHHMSPCATEHNLIAVGTSSSQAKLIDMRTGSSIHILKGHSKSIYCVKWSPCLPFIVTTGSSDGRIFFWDIRMARGHMVSLDQHNGNKSVGVAHTGQVLSMEFSETGYDLISYGSDETVRRWDTFSGRNMLVNYGKVFNELQRCLKICITSATHQPLLFIAEGEMIRVFDVSSGQLINNLSGHFRQINCCYYNPFSQEVYSGSNDRNLLIWTPDHKVEDAYMNHLDNTLEQKNKPSTIPQGTGSHTNGDVTAEPIPPTHTMSSVLADTWSDSEDEGG